MPKDIRGLHGTNHTMAVFDELWGAETSDVLESLAVSPARNSPLTIYASYAGLLSQQRAGVPWFDIMQRVQRATIRTCTRCTCLARTRGGRSPGSTSGTSRASGACCGPRSSAG